jgi:hypothetical protein
MTQLRIATPETDIQSEARARDRAVRDRFVNGIILNSWRRQLWGNLFIAACTAMAVYWLDRRRGLIDFGVPIAVGFGLFLTRVVMDTGRRVDAIAKVLQKNGVFVDYVQRG